MECEMDFVKKIIFEKKKPYFWRNTFQMKCVIVIRHLATISVYSKTFYYQRNRKRKWLKSFLNPMNNKRSNFRFASDVVSEIAKKVLL